MIISVRYFNFCLFVFLLSVSLFSNELNISPFRFNNNEEITSIYFSNQDTGFIGSSTGKLYATLNGGTNWDTLITSDSDAIYSIFCTNKAIFIGKHNFTYNSSDNGKSWEKDSLNTCPEKFYKKSEKEFFRIGIWNSKLYKSDDSGNIWKLYFDFNIFLENFHGEVFGFINDSIACCGGYPYVSFISNNGGVSWDSISSSSTLLSKVFFSPNNSTAIFAGYKTRGSFPVIPKAIISYDAGKTWTSLFSQELPGEMFIGALGVDSSHFILCTNKRMVNFSENGLSWELSDQLPLLNYTSFCTAGKTTFWIGSENGLTYKCEVKNPTKISQSTNKTKLDLLHISLKKSVITINLSLPYSINSYAELIMLNGKVVSRVLGNKVEKRTQFNLSTKNISSGVYIARIVSDNYEICKILNINK